MSNVKRNTPYNYIADNYDWLSDGDSVKGNLNGGCYRMDELGESPSGCDLTVKREGTRLIFNCFSGSCPCKGSVRIGRGACSSGRAGGKSKPTGRTNREQQRILETRRILRGSVQHLPKPCLDYLERNNIGRIDAKNSGVLWNEAKNSVVFPLLQDGTISGVLVRKIGELAPNERKWINYVKPDDVFFTEHGGNAVSIVEAPTSAIALNGIGLDALATLGTNISDEKLENIVKHVRKYKKVVFIPDGDVEREKIRQIKKRLTLKGIDVTVLRVETKPRYELEKIRRFIEEA